MEKKLKDMGVELNELAIAMMIISKQDKKRNSYLNFGIMKIPSISFRQSTTSIGATHRMGVGECHTTYWFLIYSCTICKLFSLTVVTK